MSKRLVRRSLALVRAERDSFSLSEEPDRSENTVSEGEAQKSVKRRGDGAPARAKGKRPVDRLHQLLVTRDELVRARIKDKNATRLMQTDMQTDQQTNSVHHELSKKVMAKIASYTARNRRPVTLGPLNSHPQPSARFARKGLSKKERRQRNLLKFNVVAIPDVSCAQRHSSA